MLIQEAKCNLFFPPTRPPCSRCTNGLARQTVEASCTTLPSTRVVIFSPGAHFRISESTGYWPVCQSLDSAPFCSVMRTSHLNQLASCRSG
ncbi:hypothetical protein BJX64DRAFT_269054 [Aspergillus heterothallicus]